MTTFQIENGDNQFELPTVISNYDGLVAGIDAQIITAGNSYQFSCLSNVAPYGMVDSIPDAVYDIMAGYVARGFICTYDGDAGTLLIEWHHPDMSWQDVRNITRAFPGAIANLGFGFTAPQIYLCLTNGNDLRTTSTSDLYLTVQKSIGQSAVLGNTNMTFGFPGVPASTIINLYSEIFDNLNSSGFGVSYSTSMQQFVVTWDAGTLVNAFTSGQVATVTALS
jgi:hypothetical protein